MVIYFRNKKMIIYSECNSDALKILNSHGISYNTVDRSFALHTVNLDLVSGFLGSTRQ